MIQGNTCLVGQPDLCQTAGMDPYTPSDELKTALSDYEEALRIVEERRLTVYDAVAADMKTYGVTNARMAEHLPWTEEHVRKIARARGVQPQRKSTVRSIGKTAGK